MLNIGAGSHKLKGFINVDIEPNADVVVDVTKGLPFENSTVDGIFSEHFIEHLSLDEACFFLRECRRVLKPGGVVRLATPDLEEIINFYNSAGPESGSAVEKWLHPDWSNNGYEWVQTRAEMLNLALREWGHKWLFDAEELIRISKICGFNSIERKEYQKSSYECFSKLEYRESSKLILELKKDIRKPFDGEPLVSICIPAYKQEYFKQCLDSVLLQTYSNIEIVISDDSNDQAIERIAARTLADRPYRLVKNLNKGGDNNYLNALAHAQGSYIKFLNDDDLLAPDCVEILVQFAEQNPYATLITSSRLQFEQPGNLFKSSVAFDLLVDCDSEIDSQLIMKKILTDRLNYVGEPNCVLFRKDDVKEIYPDILSLGGQKSVDGTPGDVVMWLNLLSKGNLIYVTKCLSYLRVHNNQIQAASNYNYNGVMAWGRLVNQAVRLGMNRLSDFNSATINKIC